MPGPLERIDNIVIQNITVKLSVQDFSLHDTSHPDTLNLYLEFNLSIAQYFDCKSEGKPNYL